MMQKILQALAIIVLVIGFTLNGFVVNTIYKELGYLTEQMMLLTYQQEKFQKEVAQSIVRDIQIVKGISNLRESLEIRSKFLQQYSEKLVLNSELKNEIKQAKNKWMEYKFAMTNVLIINTIKKSRGSGTTIKYNGKFYIISAGHLVDKVTDKLVMVSDGQVICNLKVVKVDKKSDLLLLEPSRKDIAPTYWIDLARQEPFKTEKIYVIGNPSGVEDILSEGRVIGYDKESFYFTGTSYFGASGGGILNSAGELVGVISFMKVVNPFGVSITSVPSFVLNGAIRLQEIYKFLEGVK
jgi:S1-C subfamily serine protease